MRYVMRERQQLVTNCSLHYPSLHTHPCEDPTPGAPAPLRAYKDKPRFLSLNARKVGPLQILPQREIQAPDTTPVDWAWGQGHMS